MQFISRTDETVAVAGDDTIALTFPFLERSHVLIFVRDDDDAAAQSLYLGSVTFIDDSTIRLNPNPVGQRVQAVRRTPKNNLLRRLTTPGAIDGDDFNFVAVQLLYLAQENCDDNAGSAALDLLALIGELRATYELHLGGPTWQQDEVSAAVVIGRSVILRANLPTARFQAFSPPASTAEDHVISIRKNGTEVGTLTVAAGTGVTTVNFPIDVGFVLGDTVSLVTTTNTGLQDYAVVLPAERI